MARDLVAGCPCETAAPAAWPPNLRIRDPPRPDVAALRDPDKAATVTLLKTWLQ